MNIKNFNYRIRGGNYYFPLFLLLMVLCLFNSSVYAQKNSAVMPADHESETSEEKYLLYVDSADMYISRDRWDRAEEMIRKAMKISPGNPGNPLLFSNLGICLSRQGKYGEALEAFEIGLVKAPESNAVLSARALTYLAMNRPADALKDLDIVLKADSTLLQPRRLRARILLATSNLADAEADFLYLARHFPSEPAGPAGAGKCAMIRGHLTDAIQFFDNALSIDQDPDTQVETHVDKIACLISLDKLNDADHAVRETLRAFPRCGELYLLRSILHSARYRNEEAEIDKKIAKEYGADPQIIEWMLPKNMP